MATTTITTMPVTVTSSLPKPPTAMSMSNTEFLVRFPPFPETPDGAQVIPWKEFKERGISVHPGGEDNSTEIDACGVPTIALASAHTTDWCKTETKRAKFGKGGPGRRNRKRKAGGGMGGGPTAMDWEEYWEEREVAYRVQGTYDPHLDAYERLCQGALDFKNLRPWPLAQKQSGPVYVWGEFLRFAGIPLNLDGGGAKVEEPSKKQKTDDDSDSDYGDDDDDMGGILNPHSLSSMDAVMKAQVKGEAFLKDPALMLKVFLSSYARDRGIIWTDVNLAGAPILMRFFVNFLIDNKVLPNREEKAIKHESTRRVLDLALKELPITSKLAKVWPDDFHKACKECWGSKTHVFVFRSASPMEGVIEGGGEETAPGANAANEAPTRSEGDGLGNSADMTTTTIVAEEGTGWGSGDWENSNGWGAGTTTNWDSGIVTVDVDEEGEVETRIVEVTADPDGDTNVAGDDADANDDENWNTFQPASFLPFLGPTALPLTHTTGIVETSVRRIKALFPPSSDTSKFPVAKGLSAEAVEGALKRTFGVILFEPWVNWNKGEEPHLSMPKILESSRGVVKTNNATSNGELAARNEPVASVLPPFDPHEDSIHVIVDSANMDLFSVGMGCLGTWVQLARLEDLEPQDPKKKKKKNAKMDRFWYIEESLRVIPSYYTYLTDSE